MVINQNDIRETIENAFPFSVDKFRLSGPDGMRTEHWGLFRSDSAACVGNACRASYNPHTVDDIATLAEAGAEAFDGPVEITTNWRSGHYLSIAPTDSYRRSIFGTDDNIFPRLLISAGYDGKAFKGSLGLYRDACTNLQMLQSVSGGASESIKHTIRLESKLSGLQNQFKRLVAKWGGLVDAVEKMEAKTVKFNDFLRSVYPGPTTDSGRSQTSYESKIETIFRRLTKV